MEVSMEDKKELVKKKKTVKKKLLFALPIYILYVLIVEVYFGFGMGELWDRFVRYTKKYKLNDLNKLKIWKNKNKNKFIRIKI